jgi:hypothetical protein
VCCVLCAVHGVQPACAVCGRAAVRLNAPVTMSQTADPQVFERLQRELASRGEQVQALQASLELARHVHKELQGELESQRRAAVLAAQAHRNAQGQAQLHRDQVDENLAELRSVRFVVEKLLVDQRAADGELQRLRTRFAEQSAMHISDLERHKQRSAMEKSEMEHRYKRDVQTANLVNSHLTRQLSALASAGATADLTEEFIARHKEEVKAAHQSSDELVRTQLSALRSAEGELKALKKEQADRDRQARAQLAELQLKELQAGQASVVVATANSAAQIEGKQTPPHSAGEGGNVFLFTPGGGAPELPEMPAPESATVNRLRGEIRELEAELARSQATITLGARQSAAFTAALKKARAAATDDRRMAAEGRRVLHLSQQQLHDVERELARSHDRETKLKERCRALQATGDDSSAQDEAHVLQRELEKERDMHACAVAKAAGLEKRLSQATRTESRLADRNSSLERMAFQLQESRHEIEGLQTELRACQAHKEALEQLKASAALVDASPPEPAMETQTAAENARLTTQLQEYSREIEGLQTELRACQADKEALEQLKASAALVDASPPEPAMETQTAAENARLTTQLQEYRREIEGLQTELRACEADNGEQLKVMSLSTALVDASPTKPAATIAAPDSSILNGTYRINSACTIRVERELASLSIGTFEKGEIIDVTESTELASGATRLKCARGWVSLKPHLLVKVSEDDATPSAPVVEPQAQQHTSVAVDGVDIVASLGAGVAATVGAVPERVFMVKQTHLSGAPEEVQLKVGSMGVTVFDGSTLLESYIYTKLKQWSYRQKSATVTIELKSSATKRQTDTGTLINYVLSKSNASSQDSEQDPGHILCALMEAQALALAKLSKAPASEAIRTGSATTAADSVAAEFVESAISASVATAADFKLTSRMVGRYRVARQAKAKSGFALTSEELGMIPTGTVVDVSECKLLPDGRIRAKTEKGWMSVESQTGDTLLTRVKQVVGPLTADEVSDLLGEYRVLDLCSLKSALELTADTLGTLDHGEVIEVKEAARLPKGTIRLRCGSGWVSFKPHLMEKLEVTDDVEIAKDAKIQKLRHNAQGGRRHSVSAEGVEHVSSLGADVAATVGAVPELVFTVKQAHIPGAPEEVQLKVGGMGVAVFDGSTLLESHLYVCMQNWGINTRRGNRELRITVRNSKNKVKFATGEAAKICEVMTSHAKALQAAKKAQRKQGQKAVSKLQAVKETAPTAANNTDASHAGQYRVIHLCTVRAGCELISDSVGTLDEGEVIEVTKSASLPSGVTRLKCASGWVTLKPHLLEQVCGDDAVPNMQTHGRRRMSVAVGGMSSSLGAGASPTVGAVLEEQTEEEGQEEEVDDGYHNDHAEDEDDEDDEDESDADNDADQVRDSGKGAMATASVDETSKVQVGTIIVQRTPFTESESDSDGTEQASDDSDASHGVDEASKALAVGPANDTSDAGDSDESESEDPDMASEAEESEPEDPDLASDSAVAEAPAHRAAGGRGGGGDGGGGAASRRPAASSSSAAPVPPTAGGDPIAAATTRPAASQDSTDSTDTVAPEMTAAEKRVAERERRAAERERVRKQREAERERARKGREEERERAKRQREAKKSGSRPPMSSSRDSERPETKPEPEPEPAPKPDAEPEAQPVAEPLAERVAELEKQLSPAEKRKLEREAAAAERERVRKQREQEREQARRAREGERARAAAEREAKRSSPRPTRSSSRDSEQPEDPDLVDDESEPEDPDLADDEPEPEDPDLADDESEPEDPDLADDEPEPEDPDLADDEPESEDPDLADDEPEPEDPDLVDDEPESEDPDLDDAASAKDAFGVEGQYRVLKKAVIRKEADLKSKELKQPLKEKQLFDVIEVKETKDGKLRARVAKPAGWITLKEGGVELVKAKVKDARLGDYTVLAKTTVRKEADLKSKEVKPVLNKNQHVTIVEIKQMQDGRIRGKCKKPQGWITIKEDCVKKK